MEMPDKVFTDENTRLWRVEATVMLFDDADALTDFRFQNPVPVFSGDRVVGAATLEIRGRRIHGTLAMDYSIPERLEFETGTKVWALPHGISRNYVRVQNKETGKMEVLPGIMTIDGIQLRKDGDPEVPAIGEGYL